MEWNELAGKILIGIGTAFNLLGCIGLLRLPDVYNRLQAGTKCVTFGTCGILLGVFVISGINPMGIKALIGIPFVLLTAPVGAHALARGAHIFGVKPTDKTVVDHYAEDRSKNPGL